MADANTNQRGATLLLVAFISAFLLIPIVGTCIDGAVLYLVKAKLSSAVDAAALATARSLNVGQTVDEQKSHAQYIGAQYFSANFPTSPDQHGSPGPMGAKVVGGQDITNSIVITEPVLHKRVVTVTVSVTLPTYFMRMIGFNNSTVSASGQATRRDSNVMLVLDRSNSMNQNGSCAALISSAENFVEQFVEGRDRLGLVTYQTGAHVDFKPSLTFKTPLKSLLDSLQCGGDTSTAQGLSLGYDQIVKTINQPGALNVIVLFTDGQPNAIVAPFPIKRASDTRYDAVNTSQLVPTPASNCKVTAPDTLTGVLSDASAETAPDETLLNATGYTAAVLSYTGVPITNRADPTTIAAPGCAFPNSNWGYSVYGRRDIAFIPNQDLYKNSTLDRPNLMPKLDTFQSGNYATQIRPDMPRTVRWAAFNATDSKAFAIRNDPTFTTLIYTIGLQGNEPMLIDQDFMKRLANDGTYPPASNYDATKPSGRFILATDTAELAQAFQTVASQILRLSQ
jgi:Flp pilus assembly protein TadG